MRRRTGLAAAALGVGALAVPFFGASAQASPDRVALHGTTPSWATPSRAAPTIQSAKRISFRVHLPLRHPNQAKRTANAVSNPSSGRYGHYLSPQGFNHRFAPSHRTVQRVEHFLRSRGLTVKGVPENRRWVRASGTVHQVEQAFSTNVRTYHYKGHFLRAPAKPLSVPKSVAPSVLTVTGVDDSGVLRHPHHVRPRQQKARAPGDAEPKLPPPSECSEYWDQHEQTVPSAYGDKDSYPTYLCGYVPDQLQTAYGVKSEIATGRDGSGVTVAIIDAYASPTIKSDANTYFSQVGVPKFQPGQFRQIKFGPFDMKDECNYTAWWGEETLDVEAVHGMAPGADIIYLGAKNCDKGITKALNYVVQHHTADIVSNSYGFVGEDVPASSIQAMHRIFIQAAAEGIGMYFSSGDYGNNPNSGSSSNQPDYSASDPYVTAVGGTSLAIDGNGGYEFETGWGTKLDPVAFKDTGEEDGYQEPLPGHFRYGAGGGTSTLFGEPDYQKGVVPPYLARKYGSDPMHVVPDVAAVADPYTGMLVGQTDPGSGEYDTYAIGGTSLACPVFAGIQALASQGRAEPIGFANPLLYSLAGSDAYHDVTPSRTAKAVTNPEGSYLVTLARDAGLHTAYGYDNVTGMGSPHGSDFVDAEVGDSGGSSDGDDDNGRGRGGVTPGGGGGPHGPVRR